MSTFSERRRMKKAYRNHKLESYQRMWHSWLEVDHKDIDPFELPDSSERWDYFKWNLTRPSFYFALIGILMRVMIPIVFLITVGLGGYLYGNHIITVGGILFLVMIMFFAEVGLIGISDSILRRHSLGKLSTQAGFEVYWLEYRKPKKEREAFYRTYQDKHGNVTCIGDGNIISKGDITFH